MYDGDIRGVVVEHLPAYSVMSVERMGGGTDNVVYVINDDLVLRFARAAGPAELVRESRLLEEVARISPLRVPEPVFVDLKAGCLAYHKVPGSPLLDHPPANSIAIAEQLGSFLSVLHNAPLDHFKELAARDVVPLEEWRDEAAETWPSLHRLIPREHHRAIDDFFESAVPDGPTMSVFSHNDLGIEHVLIDPASYAVTGVIDWSDAAIVDPAYDFGLIHRDLGPHPLRAALDHYKTPEPSLARRAEFYARCSVFEDFAYGIETGNSRYLTKCLRSLTWLFP